MHNHRENLIRKKGLESNWRKLASLDGKILQAQSSLGTFLETYLVCEAIARKLISDKTRKPCPQTLYSSSIGSSIRYFGIRVNVRTKLVERIFEGGAGIRHSKTPRQLRNGIVHGLNEHDCREILERHEDLRKVMNTWLDLFR